MEGREPVDPADTELAAPSRDAAPFTLAAASDWPSGELDLDARARLASLRQKMFGVPAEPPRIDRFVLLEALGAGGMGVVYAANDPRLGRKVALKVVRPDGATANPDREARLLREARTMARLSHPNVVQIHEVGVWDGRVYIAMELVAGQTLAAWLAVRDRDWREILDQFRDAGRGLAAAHAVGVVHRDFKPENVLVGDDGRVRVTDFGLARGHIADGSSTVPGSDDLLAALVGLGPTAALAGTPGYMAPEQLLGQHATAASDQFSFCVALYAGLHGVRPFAGEDPRELARAVLAGDRRELPRQRIPGRIHRALVRGLAREPVGRFPDMPALLAALDPGKGWRLAAPIAAALVTGSAAALLIAGPTPCADADTLLRGTWDPERRTAVEAAFESANLPDAAVLAASTVAALDGYAGDAADAYLASCQAHQRGESSSALHDLRVVCIRRRLHVARSVVDAIASGDGGALRGGPAAVGGLISFEACDDVPTLLQRAEVEPADPAAAARIAAVLDEARARELVGDLARSVAWTADALVDARRLNHAPTLAEALYQHARLAVLAREMPAADAALREALMLAIASRHDTLVGDLLVWRLLAAEGRVHEKLQEADAWMQRVAAGSLQRAEYDLARSLVFANSGDAAGAEAASGAAVATRARLLGPEHLKTAIARINHGNYLAALGHGDAARKEHRLALASIAAHVGEHHPLAADAHYNLAADLLELGTPAALAEARTHLLASHATMAAGAGATPPVELADSHIALAELARRVDDPQDAETHAAAAIAVYDHHPDHPNRGAALVLLGALQLDRGRPDAALATFTAARTALAAAHGEASEYVGAVDGDIADVLLARDDVAAAVDRYEAAVRTIEAALGPSAPMLRAPLEGLGAARLAQDRPCAAILPLARARSLLQAEPDPTGPAALDESLESARSRCAGPTPIQ